MLLTTEQIIRFSLAQLNNEGLNRIIEYEGDMLLDSSIYNDTKDIGWPMFIGLPEASQEEYIINYNVGGGDRLFNEIWMEVLGPDSIFNCNNACYAASLVELRKDEGDKAEEAIKDICKKILESRKN